MTEEWGNGREGQAEGTPELFGESGPAKQKDIFEKSLEDYEDVFRDIVNVLLFRGEEIVQEGTLNEGGIRSVYGAMGKGREQERDCGKIWKGQEKLQSAVSRGHSGLVFWLQETMEETPKPAGIPRGYSGVPAALCE